MNHLYSSRCLRYNFEKKKVTAERYIAIKNKTTKLFKEKWKCLMLKDFVPEILPLPMSQWEKLIYLLCVNIVMVFKIFESVAPGIYFFLYLL